MLYFIILFILLIKDQNKTFIFCDQETYFHLFTSKVHKVMRHSCPCDILQGEDSLELITKCFTWTKRDGITLMVVDKQ